MSDTPIYDSLDREYLKRAQLDVLTDFLSGYVDHIPTRYFELAEECVKEVPAILDVAARAVGNLLIPTLADRQNETETERELASYVGGIIDALKVLRTLPHPGEIK